MEFDDDEERDEYEAAIVMDFTADFASAISRALAKVPRRRRGLLMERLQDKTSCFAPWTSDTAEAIANLIRK